MKRFLGLFFLLNVFLFSVLAFAQEKVNVDSSDSILNHLQQDLVAGKVVAIVAGGILLLVFLFRKFVADKLGLGSGSLPWVAIVLGIVVGICGDVVNGMTPGQAAQVALLSGPAAMTTWAALFKLISKKG